jgi:hypothetical protein
MTHHFHSEKCYAVGPGDTEVLVCGLPGPVITAHVMTARYEAIRSYVVSVSLLRRPAARSRNGLMTRQVPEPVR